MVKSAYIHIPFCKSKCYYCSFISFPELELKKEYLKALETEINYFYNNEPLNTLYIGGGTPSLLEISEFENILRHFKYSSNCEITTELNPESTESNGGWGYLRSLYDLGINRLSFGAQTFNNDILKYINRRHDSSQIIKAVEGAKSAGFKNINLDFIYGLPNQTVDMFIQDLKKAVDLGVEHISFYGLTIESGCYFYGKDLSKFPNDELQADMYLEGVNFLKQNGFEHYEISNFSLPNFNSRHNLNYWKNQEYYGFGVSAHGYTNGVRYGNKLTLKSYIQNPTQHNESKLVTKNEQLEEEIFLGFRISSGIDIKQINLKFGIDFEGKYDSVLNKYLKTGHMIKTDKGYALSSKGFLVSNTILAEFL